MKKKQNNLEIRILLTGGHAGATAYAVIEELRARRNILWQIYWIGAGKAIEGKNISTLEREVFPKISVNFYQLFTGRIQRRFTPWTIPSLMRIPFGFIHAFLLVSKIKPKITLSFGGFVAFPVVVASWFLGIPVVIHEQTAAIGRANKYSTFFARKIALAREESKGFFPPRKSVVVGNPISKEIAKIKPKKSLGEPPTIFITGGSRGSVTINDLTEKILQKLLTDCCVIHQTGVYQLEKFEEIKNKLNKNIKNRYEVYGMIAPWEWYKILGKADIIVSRSGANIVSEIMAVKRPSILIPLPLAYYDEQKKNALFAQKYGIAKVLDQGTTTSEKLLAEIYNTRKKWYKIVAKVKSKPSPDQGSAAKLVDVVEELV